jgi:hypothetical protein
MLAFQLFVLDAELNSAPNSDSFEVVIEAKLNCLGQGAEFSACF